MDGALTGLIAQVQHFSLHDGPGIRTTFFFKGCPLDCWWCHNPENLGPRPDRLHWEDRCVVCGACVNACPAQALEIRGSRIVHSPAHCDYCGECEAVCPRGANAIVGRVMDVEAALCEALKDKAFFDSSGGGVTFSGGEPTRQLDFLIALARACADNKIQTALDTCGYFGPDHLPRLVETFDLFIYDVKIIDPEKHKRYTGRDNHVILENLSRLAQSGRDIVLRFPLIAGVNDSPTDLEDARIFLKRFKPRHGFDVEFLPYHPLGESKIQALGRQNRIPNGRPKDETVRAYRAMAADLGFLSRINAW